MSQSLTASIVAPPRLRSGDTVAIPAPASPVDRDRLERGIAVLRERYDVRVGDGVYSAEGYLAGSDERRRDELNSYLRDSDVRAIFIARGGYGTLRIVDDLDADALRADPVPIVGFSDATVLLSWALNEAGVRPIHGPVVGQLGELGAGDRAWLFRLLEEPAAPGEIASPLSAIGARGEAGGAIEGPLLGGNLSLVAHLIGTRLELELRGAIAFLEDVDERPYAVDRYFTRMALARAFSGCKAVVLGDFLRCEGRADVFDVIDERLREFDLPGARGLAVGHGTRNLALPFGARAALDPARQTLAVLEPAVT
jgi:muramoyltetrapeptide carboxypeptidase